MNQAYSHDNLWNPVIAGSTKRPFLGWLSNIGMGLLSLFEQSSDSFAGDSTETLEEIDIECVQRTPECCSLWYDIDHRPFKRCVSTDNRAEFDCGENFHRHYWTCMEGSCIAACAECVRGNSCTDGMNDDDFECSTWFWVESPCNP